MGTGARIRLTEDEAVRLGAGGLVVREDFIDPAVLGAARTVLGAWHLNGRLTPAGVGRDGVRVGIRGDATTWLEPRHAGPLAAVFSRFEALRVELAAELRLGLHRFSVQAARYEPGAAYKRHVDAFRGDPGRILTAIVYLNPAWLPEHGGRLRAWTPDGVVEVEPVLGRLVLFRADQLAHEVSAAQAVRWAITAWYRGAEPIPLLPDPRA